ncbi:hypothetical protein HPHPP3B_0045 [Helicobacter pylori Hp P-3b]|nr:hypothetical protein HPHPP3B_0045 [Helicobacter pylori Hp P-3b]
MGFYILGVYERGRKKGGENKAHFKFSQIAITTFLTEN